MKLFSVFILSILTMDAVALPRPTFISGVDNAEDLVRLPGTPWIVASHFNVNLLPPHDIGFGPLEAIRIDTHEVHRLYPTAATTVDWDRDTYPDCPAPPDKLSSHGVNVRPLGENRFRLYVVNHGGRESIEVIDAAVSADRIQTAWRGCLHTPEGIGPNAVAPLSDGGLAVSGGGVAVWRTGQGWTKVEGIHGAPNGVEVSRDGQWLFVAIYDEGSVIGIPLGGGATQVVFKSDFLADNLRWGEDGYLYLAGQYSPKGWESVEGCMKVAVCDIGFVVAQIDPNTLTARELIRSPGISGAFGGATTALQIADRLWLGTFHGDRIAILPLAKPPGAESAKQRAALPLYKVIPAAKDSELTPAARDAKPHNTWLRSNADAANTRYSALSQINSNNVSHLELAWIYRSGDGKGNIQANPVIVDGVMYAPTVGGKIMALDAENGHEIWRFQPLMASNVGTARDLPSVGYGPATRGLAYWEGTGAHEPRLFFMANGYVFALDPESGRAIDTFGDHGRAASAKGAGTSGFLGAVAPAFYDNIVVAPNQNIVEAFDAITGVRLWQFNTLQYPVKNPDEDNGGNVWGGIALDEIRGIVFVATGDPHPNFIGIDRPGNNPYTNSVLALDARTGRLLWSFQDIAHDLWDMDISAPPNLVTVTRHGNRFDAVAQVTKLGNTLLLDRLTGKPLFPYRLRRAPISPLPGERTSPYQPDLQLPEPFSRQVFTINDATDITPAATAFVLNQLRGAKMGWFEPFEADRPTVFYGVHGGAEWTGAAFDPVTATLYISANEFPSIVTVSRRDTVPSRHISRGPSPGGEIFEQHCAICHGQNREGKGTAPSLLSLGKRLSESDAMNILNAGRGGMPPVPISEEGRQPLLNFIFDRDDTLQQPAPSTRPPAAVSYASNGFPKLLDDRGYPGSKPPWGTLNAIDLNTGQLRWKVPLGEHDELTREGIRKTGTHNFGGALVTAGGLVFCAGTLDLKIRAFDKVNGRELWEYKLPFGGYAPPATYAIAGRQYVVIAATGGGKLGGEMGDAYVAFALPK